MNLLLIDHEDSFTYNLAHLLSGFGNLEVTNFYDVKENSVKKSDVIIFSPGPGKPLDYPISLDIYNNYKSKKKIIGICLGFQLIANGEGGTISKQEKIFHGYQTFIRTNTQSLRFPNNALYQVGRYHSLKLKEPFNSSSMHITMRCEETNVAMCLESHKYDICGLQFHPDSFLTPNGKQFIRKIIQFKK